MNRYSERIEPSQRDPLTALIALLLQSFGRFIVGIIIGILAVVLVCVALWLLMNLLRFLG